MDPTGLVIGVLIALAVGSVLLLAGAVTRWRVRRPRQPWWALALGVLPGLVLLVVAVTGARSLPRDPRDLDARRLQQAAAACVGADAAPSSDVSVERVEEGPLREASHLFWGMNSRRVYVVTVTDRGGATTCRLRWSNTGSGRFVVAA